MVREFSRFPIVANIPPRSMGGRPGGFAVAFAGAFSHAINALPYTHGVALVACRFFREQSLTLERHVAFSSQFGELTPGRSVPGNVEGYPQIDAIVKYREATALRGRVDAAAVDPAGLPA